MRLLQQNHVLQRPALIKQWNIIILFDATVDCSPRLMGEKTTLPQRNEYCADLICKRDPMGN